MNTLGQIDSLVKRRNDLVQKAEKLRRQIAATEKEVEEIDTAMRVFEKYLVDEFGRRLLAEAKKEGSVAAGALSASGAGNLKLAGEEFELTPPAQLSKREMIRSLLPRTADEAIGPAELTKRINARYGTSFRPNLVRPPLWKLAQSGKVRVENGGYWIP